MPPLEAFSMADYGSGFNPDSQDELSTDGADGGLATQLESDRWRIINTRMGQQLISELNSFEVDSTSAGKMRVDVRSKEHHGDLVIATALALRSALGQPSGRVEVGFLENYF